MRLSQKRVRIVLHEIMRGLNLKKERERDNESEGMRNTHPPRKSDRDGERKTEERCGRAMHTADGYLKA